jgi:hypothetical protein
VITSWRYAGRAVTGLTVALASGLLITNLALWRQNSALRDGSSFEPKVGQRLTAIAGVDMNGSVKRITFPPHQRQHALLITWSPFCMACNANDNGWVAISNELAKRPDWKVVWVSRDQADDTQRFLDQHPVSSPYLLADPVYRTYLQLDLQEVPFTVTVRDGVVEKVWRGLLGQRAWEELCGAVGVPFQTVLEKSSAIHNKPAFFGRSLSAD